MMCNGADLDLAPVFDALDIGIVVLDASGGIHAWNDWMTRATGHSRETVLGKNLYEIFADLRNTRLPAAVRDALQVGSSSILTHSLNKLLPLRCPDGQNLLHNIVVRPMPSGRSAHCLLQVTDVTVSVARERILRDRQNARYHAIVDSAPDTIITTSLDRTVQWTNGAAEQVFGYRASELLGQPIDILLNAGTDLSCVFASNTVENSGGSLQTVGLRKGGEPAHFDVSFARWRADERIFVTTIWRDVTERMAADVALRESEARYRALCEALPQLVWTCDPDGTCDYFNPQWQTYTGVPAAEHLGFGWLEVIHSSDREDLQPAWNSALRNGHSFDVDARMRRADGCYRWFNLRAIPVRSSAGKIARWFGTATDITEHIEARDSLRRSNEELEARVAQRTREREVVLGQLHESQKMEIIGQLTGGVAHDFNNLLAVILGSLALLKKTFPNDPRTSRLLEGALQAGERGATLTKRLLAFARRQELKLEAVEVQKLIPDMMDFLRQSIGPSVSIMVDIRPDVQPIKIDANQLELAIMNLAVNARDAMPNGGTLTIACRNETADFSSKPPSALPPGEYVRLSVVDTGEGMSEATRAKAMEPFFTTKGVGKGTGLGLSMVQGLTAQSGGAIDISSQLGKGTAVTLWLPRARHEDRVYVPSEQTAPSAEMANKGLRILLVDDDPLVSMNTTELLMDLGHSVVEAPSASRALEMLESTDEFGVVITDYAMPNMNGLDLAIEIRRIKPDLPIVLATGYADLPPDAAPEFPRLGKPYTQQQLAEAVETALNAPPRGAPAHARRVVAQATPEVN